MKTEERIIDDRKTVYTYDDQNTHIRTTDYDENGKMSCDIQYHHNDRGQCDSWRVFDSNRNLLYIFEVIFDEYDREKEITQFNNRNALEMRTVNNYDESGIFISETHFEADGNELEDENS
jgi:antitoxin component YwqK of YwqJK toxin-antitoxin module